MKEIVLDEMGYWSFVHDSLYEGQRQDKPQKNVCFFYHPSMKAQNNLGFTEITYKGRQKAIGLRITGLIVSDSPENL